MESTAATRAAADSAPRTNPPAAKLPTPLAVRAELEHLELASLTPSGAKIQEHRRARFSKEALEELTATVKSLGVLQPIVVRPHPKPRGAIRYEIVAGERRYLASKAAGLATIPGVVRELTDDQALEIQLVENLRREGLDPLDEAIGYEELMRAVKAGGPPKHSADAIAAKIGKSRSYVYQRLKLLALCAVAREAYFDGTLGPSTAVYVARIPSEDLQKKCVGEIRARLRHSTMSAREIEKFVHENYMLRLADARFPTADATLIPKAGACDACPKRTGNNRDLFGDVQGANVCTDPPCFQAKQRAHGELELERAKAQGRNVIAGDQARKVAPHGAGAYLQGFTRVDGEHWTSNGTHVKKIASIVPKEDVTLLQDPKSGETVEVVSNDALQKALVAKGIHRTNTREGSAGDAAQRARERKAKLESSIRLATVAAIRKQHSGKLDGEDLRLVALAFWHRTHSDTQGRILEAWEIEPAKSKQHGRGYDEAGERHIKTLLYVELGRALVDLALMDATHVGAYDVGGAHTKEREAAILAAAKRAGVNAAKIRRDLEAEAKAKQAATRGQAKKKAAAPKPIAPKASSKSKSKAPSSPKKKAAKK